MGHPTSKEYWRRQDVRDALRDSQHRKCCFCENIRGQVRELDVDHFRPKAGVEDDPTHPGYWWLAYEWSNLLYACKPCNQEYKKTKFPIMGTRAYLPEDCLGDERPELVNPIDENPEEFIGFDWQKGYERFVLALGLDEGGRGRKTIAIMKLNRADLAKERAEGISSLQKLAFAIQKWDDLNRPDKVEEMAVMIRKKTSCVHRFAAFHRVFFRAQGLGKYIADD